MIKIPKTSVLLLMFVVILIFLGAGCSWSKKKKETASTPAPTPEKKQQSGKAVAPESIPQETEIQLPQKDSQGNDIAEVPRMPNSFRILWDKTDDFEEATYQIKEKSEKILEYYQKLLPERGWQFSSGSEDSISFKKGEAQIDITIEDFQDGITTYHITHWFRY